VKRLIVLVLVVIFTVSSIPASVFATNGQYNYQFFSDNNIFGYNPDDTTCASSSGGNVSTLVGSDNRQKIWNYLTAKGLSPQQTAGVMGNLQSESAGSWSPTVNEYGSDFGDAGYGIAQWTNSSGPGGRRDLLVAALNAAQPDAMTKYYNADYSVQASATDQTAGFIPKSASTGTPMDTASNDGLLLAELNYLYTDANNRTVGNIAVTAGLATKGDSEWKAIQLTTTVDDASNLWLYSYEIPGAILDGVNTDAAKAVSAARTANGNAILTLYSNASTGTTCGDGTKQQLAAQIANNPNITYANVPDTLRQKQLIADVASGASDGNTYPCGVNIQILRIIAALGKDHKITINDLNRACTNSDAGGASSPASRHYDGDGSAVDLGPIDGMASYNTAGATLIVSIVAPLLAGQNSYIGQQQCPGLSSSAIGVPSGVGRYDDACTHLHVDVDPSVDPNLQCVVGVRPGTCNNAVKG
jgi:hypothetical protein